MKKHCLRILTLVLALALPLLGGVPARAEAGDALDPAEELVFDDAAEDETLEEAMRRAAELRHILLLGIDARPGEKTGRSDTMVIVTLDPENDAIKLTSLMRDLYVEIPGHKNNRLNAAYTLGGPELVMETIEANFGVRTERYVAVNFSILADLIDQLGGIELTVESDYYVERINAVIREDNRALGIDLNDGMLQRPGTQRFTGKQAQAYARYRYGTSDGDFGRTARQREVLGKIFDRLSGMSGLELGALALANLDKVSTNLSLDDIMALIPALPAMRGAQLRQLRVPVDGGYKNQTVAGMAVLVPDRTKNKRAISEFLTE